MICGKFSYSGTPLNNHPWCTLSRKATLLCPKVAFLVQIYLGGRGGGGGGGEIVYYSDLHEADGTEDVQCFLVPDALRDV